MIPLKSNPIKFLVLLVITIGIFVIWQSGMQEQHASLLAKGTNFVENVFGSENRIVYEIDKGEPIFMVHILVDGRRGRFPQKIGPILQPTVMILAWQLFLFFVLSPRKAMRLLLINMGIFIVIQVFFFTTTYWLSCLRNSKIPL